MSSCIEKRAMLYLVSTATSLALSLTHVVHGCPPLRAVDVRAVRHSSASPQEVAMDPASQALARDLPTGVRRTYTALVERSDAPVSRTTVWYRAKGRPSRRMKAQRQQYLSTRPRK
jgi:hypothetical protein